MSTYQERDATRVILLSSSDGGTTWGPVNPSGGSGGGGDASAANQLTQISQLSSLDGKAYAATSTFLATALSNTVNQVKASAGALFGYHCYNPNSTVVYIQFFDAVPASVTLGTTVPKMSLAVPPKGMLDTQPSHGIQFANAVSVACTTTSTGATSPASGVLTNVWFV